MISPDRHQIKKAIVSVSDKSGIVEFCRELVSLDIEIYSTGGTAKLLENEGIDVKSVSEITNFPEILDGRVKTLHPAIHAGLLADLGKIEHKNQLETMSFESIDLLVVNLYPFEDTLKNPKATHEMLIENIDIGGPTMLRSAAKNYKWTLPVINLSRYNEIIDLLKNNNCTIPEKYRSLLAGEVFTFTAYYDSLISGYLNKFNQVEIPEKLTIPVAKEYDLRYGENPHQKAALLGNFSSLFEKLHGKELSFNNIIDINAASQLILEFDEPTLAIIKHTNPCGVATGKNLKEAWEKAFATDNVSPFGGIVAVNRKIDAETAEAIHDIFLEVIIAPDYSQEALTILTKKRDRRLIRTDFDKLRDAITHDIRSVAGGLLMQTADNELKDDANIRVVTEKQPSEYELRAMMFAWKISKHVKSNAIVYTSDDRTLAIGAGQMSRVDSSRIAVEKAKTMGIDLAGSVVASDAFFPFADGLLQAVDAGAVAVIQPGGSVRDNEVIEAANQNKITMIFTNMRHFRH
ncbi:MAG: bifunctional phosphoribosylaminoimidazolecarboxamide formyltransferase/IMP cyclohydrolase [Candidatus Kapabacteria bacterium]|nr:bifunctional phosphoribosylaminoimidazolecarboxamide formyltransferase/IMP cyclohydrolase [Ignavibacteriota bacterium]MCW5884944.1 bifunctional phosphoribosylaminoimidazolecarboxamide formyltransferase/IMP cyclohydrolase [Candidatus Kapabacteria bacterium]